jgi:hypothetical protein
MAVSHGYDTANPRIVTGDDLIQREVNRINEFCADTSIPASEKELMLARYETAFPTIVDALIAAKTSGCIARITLNTDLNEGLTPGPFNAGEDHHSRFIASAPKDGDMGREIARLLAAGFTYGVGPYQIVSQPLYRPAATPEEEEAERHPLMHQKQLLCVVNQGGVRRVITSYSGTHNWTDNPRFNRLMVGAEPLIAAYHLEYLDLLADGYRRGLTTAEVAPLPPLRVTYADGSFVEAAYTQGRYELNRRKVDHVLKNILDKIKADPANNAMLGQWASHFVDTNGAVHKAELELLEAVPGWRALKIKDAKFVDMNAWAITPAEAGHPVFRPDPAPTLWGVK